MADYSYKYRACVLACDPMPMADGRFGAQVVIYDHRGAEVQTRRFPALEYFAEEKDAVEHAYKVGKQIVDDMLG